MKFKYLCLASTLLLTVGCRVPAEYGVSHTRGGATTEELGMTPEQGLAKLDGKEEPGAEKPYAEALDKLQSNCYEGRQEIAAMVFATVKQSKEQGMQADNLDMLNSFEQSAEDTFEERRGSCQDVWKMYKESNEEIEKAGS